MTEAERIAKATEWHAAAGERRKHAVTQIETATDDMPEAQLDAYYRIADSMLERMQLITALFPEIESTDQMDDVEKRTACKDAMAKLQSQQVNDDTEEAHSEADGILCDLLIKLGCKDVVAEWHKVLKWYA